MKKLFFGLFYSILVIAEFITALVYWLPVRIIWGKNTFDYIIEYYSLKAWVKKNLSR